MRTVLFASLLAGAVWAQSFQGSLRGRISDPGGAAIQAAKITIIDDSTALTRSTVANTVGEYTFASVNPAVYTITVESPGFKRLERRGIQVSTQAAVNVDLTLSLGEVSESVSVSSESPLLQTADASTGQVIDGQKITDLPLLGAIPF